LSPFCGGFAPEMGTDRVHALFAAALPHYSPVMARTIYKITPLSLWREAERQGRFAGAPVDVADGFIHFSTAGQVRETAARHFAGQDGLLLVAVEAEKLGPVLKYEASRGGALFPHLYGPFLLDVVAWVRPLPLGADGAHVFPPLEGE
jgi:uncharacterized protein (DUF952 family)